MAYYAVEYVFTPDNHHLQARAAHREYLAALAKDGRLAAAGALTDDAGGLLLFRAEDEAEVREIVAHDPFTLSHALDQIRIETWNPVLGFLMDHLEEG